MADDDTRNEEETGTPRGWSPHPHERMLITPLVAGLGGLLAFFTVVFIVVWLPIHTFDPPASYDWTPLSDSAVKGRNLFAENGCYVCHSGYSRPQDVREALYFLYPKVSQPGRLLRERPVAQPPRNRADGSGLVAGVRLASGRLAASALLRPAVCRSAFADACDEVALLGHADRAPDHVRRDAKRQVRAAALRRPDLLEARGYDESGVHAGSNRLRGRALEDPRG